MFLESPNSNQQMAHIKNTGYFWDTLNNTALGLYLTQKEHEFIQRSIKSGDSKKHILDVGGGSGRFAIPLHRDRHELTVVERHKRALLLLKGREKDIKCIQGDAKSLPLVRNSFDGIIAIQLFGYLITRAERLSALSEFNRVLRNNGFLLFNRTNGFSYKNVYKRIMRSKRDYIGSCHNQSYGQTIDELDQTGFLVEKTYGYNCLPFERNSLVGKSWIGFFAFWENMLGLENLPHVSHWNFIVAQKTRCL